ncbi:hypothetical protein OHA21_38295 [Actinoplanes sp. NBC_00393]|uniref:hypothetical protein n=1 Tax=Actinoplanes sp. NBC_00393 TaxID=2975953 RepID=UPI002E21F05D
MKNQPWRRTTPPSLATPHPGGCGIVRRNQEQPAADNDTAQPTPASSGDPAGRPADAQARWQAILQRLRDAAAEAGRDAADWWAQDAIGGRVTGDGQATAVHVLTGIDDGDPAVLDLLPRSHESSRQEDGPSAAERYTNATGPADTTWAALDDSRRDEATDAYHDAFDTAVLDRITDLCRRVVEPEPPH